MNNTKSELEHLKKLKSKTNFVNNFFTAAQIVKHSSQQLKPLMNKMNILNQF